MSLDKLRIIMKAFVTSYFGFCPIVWMFHSRKHNNRINTIQERALRLVYKDKISNFQKLLEINNSVTIHERNSQILVTEIFKIKQNLSPEIMNSIFIQNKYTILFKKNDRACNKCPKNFKIWN